MARCAWCDAELAEGEDFVCAACDEAARADYEAEVAAEAEADVYFVGPDNSSEDFQRLGLGWVDPMERRWLEGR